MKKTLLVILLLTTFFPAFSQQKFTLSGYIKDAKNGEDLIGASVFVPQLKKGVSTNTYGFFSLTLPADTYTIKVSSMGYSGQVFKVRLFQDIHQNMNLEPANAELQEAVVTAKRKDENVTKSEMGRVELPIEQIKTLPVIFGEVDILKAIQLLPGVQSAGEGNTGFYVRGGGPDQNLILLDEAVVYNTGHLFGFFSVFNSDAIKNVSLIKGGMPAEYGGRLSSVLDINMKEGNDKEYHATGGVGLIASRLTLEGPIIKDKSSFMVSGRRTYIDALIKPLSKNGVAAGSGYYFYDLNAKVNFKISEYDRVFASGYFGKDVFNYNSKDRGFTFKVPWGNSTGTLRWNHLFNDKLFLNTTLMYNDYQFQFNGGQDNFKFGIYSRVRDLNGKSDFTYYASASHTIKFGVHYTWHSFVPSSLQGEINGKTLKANDSTYKFANEAATYVQDVWHISEIFSVNAGLRFSYFQQNGPYNFIKTDSAGHILSSKYYKKGEKVTSYNGLEPRLIFVWLLSTSSSLKAGVTYNNQFVHLVSNAGSTLPTDIWVPSTLKVKPQKGMQYALGYFKNFAKDMFETSVEVYYKEMKNQVEYSQFYVPTITDEVEKDFVFGKGNAYGSEFFVRKNYGDLTGWVGYTFAFTQKKFPDLNNGNWFPAKYDRRNDVSVVASYQLNKRLVLSGLFIYASGNAFTVPESFVFISGIPTLQYGKVNNARMPAYHRADLSAIWNSKPNKKYESSWSFSVYNVYNRKNPYVIYFDTQGNLLSGNLKITAKEVYIFPILPSITWNFKF